jgi:hypothetical protein
MLEFTSPKANGTIRDSRMHMHYWPRQAIEAKPPTIAP